MNLIWRLTTGLFLIMIDNEIAQANELRGYLADRRDRAVNRGTADAEGSTDADMDQSEAHRSAVKSAGNQKIG